jgi:2-keto-3-deoxy-L-rhamnonate aldolase RhmA
MSICSTPYSVETTATICTGTLGIGITPLVRVPTHDAQWMSRVLDGGAQGVIVPDVHTSAQAKAIVSACRFSLLGKRSVMGLGSALGYRAVPLSELTPKLNAEAAVIVMLETTEGIENCEAIAAVDGIDVLLIGSVT